MISKDKKAEYHLPRGIAIDSLVMSDSSNAEQQFGKFCACIGECFEATVHEHNPCNAIRIHTKVISIVCGCLWMRVRENSECSINNSRRHVGKEKKQNKNKCKSK